MSDSDRSNAISEDVPKNSTLALMFPETMKNNVNIDNIIETTGRKMVRLNDEK